jgi:hypothetical protein
MTNQTIYIRHKNQTAKAVIVKHNRVRAKVRLEENFQRWGVGKVISCPYSLMYDANGKRLFNHNGSPYAEAVQGDLLSKEVYTHTPIPKYAPDEHWVSQHIGILEVLAGIYNRLSPENLTCDGEATRAWINKRRTELNREANACFILLGRQIDEEQIYEIEANFKNEYKRHHELHLMHCASN